MKRLTIVLSCLLAGLASGQINKVIPAGTANQDGDSSTAFFSGYGGGRSQQIVHGAAICYATALLRELHLRGDGTPPLTAEPARNFSQLNLWFGYTSVTPQAMTTTFASNRTGTQTQMFSGPFNLPALDTVSRPFNIVWKFSQPFIYARTMGHLVVEFELPIAPAKSNYFLDAHRPKPTQGSTYVFGTAGGFASPESYQISIADLTKLLPGGAAAFAASGFSKVYPALTIFGFSDQQYGPLPLPFDLTPLGAPGNSLYVSMDLVLPMPMSLVGSVWVGQTTLPIPNDPALGGFRFFAQGLFVDVAANKLGLVFSPGLAMTLALGTMEAQHVGHWDYTVATGNLTGSAIVMEFNGVFQ